MSYEVIIPVKADKESTKAMVESFVRQHTNTPITEWKSHTKATLNESLTEGIKADEFISFDVPTDMLLEDVAKLKENNPDCFVCWNGMKII